MKEWTNVNVEDLKPGDRIRYKFSDFDPWYDAVVVRIGDATVKTSVGSICQKAHFQRRQETLPPCENKKKWVDRKWDEIRAGDNILFSDDDIEEIEHIGDRYLMVTAESNTGCDTDKGLRSRYKWNKKINGENGWQRLEVPLTDTEKLEKLVEMSSLYFEQKEYDTPFIDFLKTQEELKKLIKEYSK